MCGIGGVFSKVKSHEDRKKLVKKMSDEIIHRGPDDFGEYHDESIPLSLIHRRLSIIDLSEMGRQPIESENGRFVLTFNGEIYNFKEIRKKIEVPCRGESDSEVLVNAIQRWGVEKTLNQIEGMFAFAVFDRKWNRIFLARDRCGEKPLYWHLSQNELAFCSELSGLKDFQSGLNPNSVIDFFALNCVPSRRSIYSNINKLEPARFIEIDLEKCSLVNEKKYWNVPEFVDESRFDEEAIERLETVLYETVEKTMISDVPIGCFLSGGIDSSILLSMMSEQGRKQVNTFTAKFEDSRHDESKAALMTARKFKTSHHELLITEKDMLESVSQMSQIYSEPFSDSSQIPTFLISKLASEKVKVVLSGDGGDEVFLGYNRYGFAPRVYKGLSVLPYSIRVSLSKLPINKLAPFLRKLPFIQFSLLQNKLSRMERLFGFKDNVDFYRRLVGHEVHANRVLNDFSMYEEFFSEINEINVENLNELDFQWYLPEDILTKVDRASMANGLEVRSPFLNSRVIEAARGISLSSHMDSNQLKGVLKRIAKDLIPLDILARPKVGFSVPLDTWLRGGLRPWGEELLKMGRRETSSWLNFERIDRVWEALQSGRQTQFEVWDILIFLDWLKINNFPEPTR